MHEIFRGTCACRDEDCFNTLEHGGGELLTIVDKNRPGSRCLSDLREPNGVRRVPASYDKDQVAFRRQCSDCMLSVRRGIADVVTRRRVDVGERLLECIDDLVGVIHAQRCLGQVDEFRGIINIEPGNRFD